MLSESFLVCFLVHLLLLASQAQNNCDPESRPSTSDKYHTDLWGFKINWTDPSEGWDEKSRLRKLELESQDVIQSVWMEQYTKIGYKKMPMPDGLHELLLAQRNVENPEWKLEDCQKAELMNCYTIVDGARIANPKSKMLNVGNMTVVNMIGKILKPIVEKWAKAKVREKPVIYGIRRYTRGAWLSSHVDIWPTHILSVILQIDQKVDQDWPLTFLDLKGRRRKIFLKPGEMLLYESAKAFHGRQFPFNGTYFDNMFVHYRPVNEKGHDGFKNHQWKDILLKDHPYYRKIVDDMGINRPKSFDTLNTVTKII